MHIAEIFTVPKQETKHLQALIVALVTVSIESEFGTQENTYKSLIEETWDNWEPDM
jgi:hypothetical protein